MNRFLKYFFVLIGCLVVIELILRLFSLCSTTITDVTKNKLLYIPGSKNIELRELYAQRKANKLGFFDREYDTSLINRKRWFFFGNSFTAAVQVANELTFENQLEDSLNKNLDDSLYEIWNLGKSGATFLDEIYFYDKIFRNIKVKGCIFQISSGSLEETSFASTYNTKINGEKINSDLDDLDKMTAFRKIQFFLTSKSVLFNLLNSKLFTFKRYLMSIKSNFKNKKSISRMDIEPDEYFTNAVHNEKISENSIAHLNSYLDYLKKHRVDTAVKIGILCFPPPSHYQDSIYRALCVKANISYLNSSSLNYQFTYKKLELFGALNLKLGSGHLSVLGNHILAKELFKSVKQSQLIN